MIPDVVYASRYSIFFKVPGIQTDFKECFNVVQEVVSSKALKVCCREIKKQTNRNFCIQISTLSFHVCLRSDQRESTQLKAEPAS